MEKLGPRAAITKNLTPLEQAKKYFNDAPKECWKNSDILTRVEKWGHTWENGGLLEYTYNDYVFKFRGLPLW